MPLFTILSRYYKNLVLFFGFLFFKIKNSTFFCFSVNIIKKSALFLKLNDKKNPLFVYWSFSKLFHEYLSSFGCQIWLCILYIYCTDCFYKVYRNVRNSVFVNIRTSTLFAIEKKRIFRKNYNKMEFLSENIYYFNQYRVFYL